MYIVTTSKRVYQITALVAVFLVLVISFVVYLYYQANVAQPDQLSQKLSLATQGKSELSAKRYHWESLAEQERQRAYSGLLADLNVTGWKQAERGAQLLVDDATSYLQDETLFHQWLNGQLQQIDTPIDQWQIESTDTLKRTINTGSYCLIIESVQRKWKLTSFSLCESEPSDLL